MQVTPVMRKSPLPVNKPSLNLPSQVVQAKVVVVEADPDSRDLLKMVLEMDGCCEVLALEDAEPVFGMQDGSRPKLLIVNVGFNDLAVISRLRQHPAFRQLPIIVTSANALPSFRNRAITAGCDHFFTKPYDADELLFALKPYLCDGQ